MRQGMILSIFTTTCLLFMSMRNGHGFLMPMVQRQKERRVVVGCCHPLTKRQDAISSIPFKYIHTLYLSDPKKDTNDASSHLVSDSSTSSSSSSSSTSSPSSSPSGMSFDDATQAIRDEEDNARMEARGLGMEEDKVRFEANKSSYEQMREKIRSRAKDLNVSKSVATAEAIKQATARAMMSGDSSSSPTSSSTSSSASPLDLSQFGQDLLENPEDDLPEEVKREIDKVGYMSFWEQVKDELKNTRFPSFQATLKQATLMLVLFFFTASIILKVDELLRELYTQWGFIPKSGQIVDFSNLALPEGFTEQMTDVDISKM